MRPVSLKLRNFGSYRGDAEIGFSDIAAAVISGLNGAGKSTLIWAIRFALWGSTRGTLDSAINDREDTCKVEFEFALGESIYLVSRQRTRKGSGSTTLTLQRLVAGAYNEADDVHEARWESLDGKTIADTQARINGLLCMTDELFVASACSAQKESDQFSAARPGERKQVLSAALGLNQWEARAKTARTMAAGIAGELKAMGTRLEALRQEAAAAEGLEAELATLSKRAEELGALLEAAIAEGDTLAEERADLLLKQQADQHAREELSEILARLEKLRPELEAARAKVGELEATITGRAEAEKQLAAAEAAQKSAELMEAARQDRERLTAELSGLEVRHAAAVNEHQAAIDALTTTIEGAKQAEQARAAGIRQSIALLEERKRSAEEARAGEIATLRSRIDQAVKDHDRDVERKRERIEALEKQAAVLEEVPCQRDDLLEVDIPPGQGAVLLEECPLIAQAREAKENLPGLKAELEALEPTDPAAELIKEVEALEATDPGASFAKDIAALEAQLPAPDPAPWAQSEAQLKALSEVAAGAELLRQGREVRERRDALGYDPEAHHQAKTDAATRDAWQRKLAAIEEAEKQLPEAEHARDRLLEQEEELTDRSGKLGDKLGPTRDWEGEIGTLDQRIAGKVGEVAKHREAISTCERERGQLNARLEAAKKAAEEVIRLERQHRELTDRAHLLNLLGNPRDGAFSRSGIPALLIEQAVPELEAAANEVLATLSGGLMSLELRTQKESSGKGMTETLDIIVYGRHGPRLYETFSGGEGMGIDLALRVGLSTLLAARAGARCELLVLDEPAAPLDTPHRQLFVEAVGRIAGRFGTVLCISHCEDVIEAFPVRLAVSQDDHGSKVEVLR